MQIYSLGYYKITPSHPHPKPTKPRLFFVSQVVSKHYVEGGGGSGSKGGDGAVFMMQPAYAQQPCAGSCEQRAKCGSSPWW